MKNENNGTVMSTIVCICISPPFGIWEGVWLSGRARGSHPRGRGIDPHNVHAFCPWLRETCDHFVFSDTGVAAVGNIPHVRVRHNISLRSSSDEDVSILTNEE